MSCKDCDDMCRQGRDCPHRPTLSDYQMRFYNLIKWFKSYFTLQKVGEGWTDGVSGKTVSYYKDCFGEVYMKDSRWALFRVKVGGEDF